MRVIGVIDLLGGRAVHARGGRREDYKPLESSGDIPVPSGDAVALSRVYLDHLRLDGVYVADLDAIAARPAQDDVVSAICARGTRVWLDAGVSSANRARHLVNLGIRHVVIGLETLTSYEALAEICSAVGGERVAFSLDLRDAEPVTAAGGIAPGEPPHKVAARAAAAGATSIIVIDLSRVGTETGPNLETIARVRDAVPDRTLLAGGGVQGLEDLARLAEAGCDGALVATAVHTGRLGVKELAAARHFRPTR